MKTALKNLFLAASLGALAIPVTSQTTGAAAGVTSSKHKATVQQRKKHSQKHISNGVQNGKRSAGEAVRLERREAGAKERDMRKDNRRRLTSAKGAEIKHKQNSASKGNHEKHNAMAGSRHSKTAPIPRSQQHRTAQLKTGQLTTRKASHLETKEASLHHRIHNDRAPNAGKQATEDQTNPQQDSSPNQIHLKKHNARMF